MGDPDAQTNQTLRRVFDGEKGCNGCDDPKAFDTSLDLGVLEELLEVASVRARVLETSGSSQMGQASLTA
jgi:hypothetical protein